MSHISKQTVSGFEAVHPQVLIEGLKVAAQLLALQGIKVTDHVYDWSGTKVSSWEGKEIIVGLEAQAGACNSSKFAGMGLAVSSEGKLAIVGDFYYSEQKARAKELRQQLESVLGGCCYFAARAMIARAKGQNVEVRVAPDTRQLQLVVEL